MNFVYQIHLMALQKGMDSEFQIKIYLINNLDINAIYLIICYHDKSFS
jgi:hypothetical protein